MYKSHFQFKTTITYFFYLSLLLVAARAPLKVKVLFSAVKY